MSRYYGNAVRGFTIGVGCSICRDAGKLMEKSSSDDLSAWAFFLWGVIVVLVANPLSKFFQNRSVVTPNSE